MTQPIPADIQALQEAFAAAALDAEDLVAGLEPDLGTSRVKPGSWSVSECLDHLATGNQQYLAAMQESANRARSQGRLRRRSARPGWFGRLFIYQLEPPPKWWSKLKAPGKIEPRPAPPLEQVYVAFVASMDEVQRFLAANADLDLASIRFVNPFIGALRFSLATGLHVIATHNRRHLWQAWGVRRALQP